MGVWDVGGMGREEEGRVGVGRKHSAHKSTNRIRQDHRSRKPQAGGGGQAARPARAHFGDGAGVGIVEDDGVDFSVYFGWWALFCQGDPCDHREVVGVRRSRESGWGGAYLLPSPHRSVGLGIYPVNSSVNGVSEAGIARSSVPVNEAECVDHAAIGRRQA
eukprot:scaffold714_cov121-Isochrysis_galbana.AAC.17